MEFHDGKSAATRIRISCPMCGFRGQLHSDFRPEGEVNRTGIWLCGRCGSSLVIDRGRFGRGVKVNWAGDAPTSMLGD
jgi:hypothetical protein